MTTSRRTGLWLPLVLLPLAGAVALPTPSPLALLVASPPAVKPPTAVRGDYVEARTASVFAGACHYNGERVTEGRSAVMGWNIVGGSMNGVDLAGVKVIAAVTCDDNLAEPAAARRSELVVDADTAARSTAAVAWVRSRCDAQIGTVVGVRVAKIAFRHDAKSFDVSADGFAAMSVRPMPDHACCSQPHLVWYQPLMPVDDRRVGYTVSAAYTAGHSGDAWQRSDENSAIYGTFR